MVKIPVFKRFFIIVTLIKQFVIEKQIHYKQKKYFWEG